MSAPLTRYQNNLSDNLYSEGSVKQFFEYIKLDKRVILKLLKSDDSCGESIFLTLGGSSVFGSASLLAGGSISALSSGAVAAQAAAYPLFGLGFLAGVPIFITMIVADNVKKIKGSDIYRDFLDDRREKIEKENIKYFIISDTILKHFLCPLSKELPKFPVKAPDGRVYEYKKIVLFLRNNPGKKPFWRGKKFKQRDLHFDIGTSNAIISRLHALSAELDIKQSESSDAIKEKVDEISTEMSITKGVEFEKLKKKICDKIVKKEVDVKTGLAEYQDLTAKKDVPLILIAADGCFMRIIRAIFCQEPNWIKISSDHYDPRFHRKKIDWLKGV